MAELAGDGNLLSRFVYATRSNVPDYFQREGATYRVLTDHLGSVRLVVNATTGEVAQRLDYDSFGRVQLDTNPGFQPFGYAGGLYDHATGLVRFGLRDYDPEAGRWTTPDPIGYAGGDTNLYAYAFNSPTNLRDPSGTIVPLIVAGAVVWQIAEAGMTVADFVDVYDTFSDPCADLWDKGLSAGGAALGMALPGGMYGRGAKKLDELVDLTSANRRRHILDGEKFSGGHRFGTGKPGKSEFPESWSDDKIIHEISDVATDPASTLRRGRGRRIISEGTRDGVNVRVVQEANGDIVTGFPTNTSRNP